MSGTESILETMAAKLARYMTAAQLITALRSLPPETPIYRHDYEYGPETIVAVTWNDEYLGPGKVVIS